MDKSGNGKVIVGTRFSALRREREQALRDPQHVTREACAALAESLDLLADTLNRLARGQPTDGSRVRDLAERARLLARFAPAANQPD